MALEPWVDRTADAPVAAAPGRTHVLVVGVSSYPNLPPKGSPPSPDPVQLETPVAGAFAFARWMRDTFSNAAAPVSTIRLLLSPSANELATVPELAAEAGQADAATRANVKAAMLDWWNECKNDPKGI